jgi:hypothetical protein
MPSDNALNRIKRSLVTFLFLEYFFGTRLAPALNFHQPFRLSTIFLMSKATLLIIAATYE